MSFASPAWQRPHSACRANDAGCGPAESHGRLSAALQHLGASRVGGGGGPGRPRGAPRGSAGAAPGPGRRPPRSTRLRDGTPDSMAAAPRGRPDMLRPEVLMARTHAGDLGWSRPHTDADSTAEEGWSACGPSSASSATARGPGGGGGRAPEPRAPGRFSQTAPPPRLAFAEVEEATGVRLSKDQLQALRRRCCQGGYGRFAGGLGGESLNGEQLRQEVFGSIVLRPGQWPKASAEVAPEWPEAQKPLGRTAASSARPSQPRGSGRGS